MVKLKKKVLGVTPETIVGVENCLVCGFKANNPIGIHKLRKNDVALIKARCKEETNDMETTVPQWNECCGSFLGYLATLHKDIYGKPYGTDQSEEDQRSRTKA